MEEQELLKLETLRDDAAAKASRTAAELGALERDWPNHEAEPIVEAKRQLAVLAGTWQRVGEWAAQEIRGDAERELV